ncbi:MAG: triose-phosphate isomerase [Chloroflexi bacterium RBG_16_48_8]|nr:MAG: triose-phosphate isomerase [Chloroflexi bacterium RBG_16_48_8]
MRIPLVAGNWKMNGTGDEALSLIDAILPELQEVQDVECVVCPPFTVLYIVSQRLSGSGIHTGAQNMFWEESGAYTGEVSPLMLKQMCKFVILGHSERRAIFGETDDTVNKRVLSALYHGLVPIICVGETLDEREGGMTDEVVQCQVRLALKDVDLKYSDEIIIAYEPVWAIGTGRSATAEGANAVIEGSIRTILKQELGNSISEATRILYGGSVKPDNAREFFIQSEIDGALVGGASLKAQDFVEIIRAARN